MEVMRDNANKDGRIGSLLLCCVVALKGDNEKLKTISKITVGGGYSLWWLLKSPLSPARDEWTSFMTDVGPDH